MGFFAKLIGSPDHVLMSSPLIGRGDVVKIDLAGTSIRTVGGPSLLKCHITLNVMLDHAPAYQAIVTQSIPEMQLPVLGSGEHPLAVRVDPANHANVCIDFQSPVPVITMPRNDTHTGAA